MVNMAAGLRPTAQSASTARLLLEANPRAALTGADLPFPEIEVKKRTWFSRFHWKR
jgi:hypothetical protein